VRTKRQLQAGENSVQATEKSNLLPIGGRDSVFIRVLIFVRLHMFNKKVIADCERSRYRSAIFFYTPEQEAVARAAKGRPNVSGRFRHPVATAIEPSAEFYRAEEYPQWYLGACRKASLRLAIGAERSNRSTR
jgi:hypothetical protein